MTGANINASRPIPVPNALEEGSPGSRWQAFRDRIYTDPDLFTFAHCRHFSTENYFDLPGPLAGFFVAQGLSAALATAFAFSSAGPSRRLAHAPAPIDRQHDSPPRAGASAAFPRVMAHYSRSHLDRRWSAFSANLIQSPARRSQASLSSGLADLSANLRHSSAS
jgi:hypothetical protein